MEDVTGPVESNPDPKTSWLNSTVVGAGITSALGDIAHESTTTILPGFLAVLASADYLRHVKTAPPHYTSSR